MNNSIEEFNKIWDDIVVGLIEDISSNNSALKQKNLKIVKLFVRHIFLKEAKVFINSYMVSATRKIDRHKLAACMVKAILFAKPFRVSLKTKCEISKMPRGEFAKNLPLVKQVLANQFLALSVAITILDGYIAADDKKVLRHIIQIPDPFPTEDNHYEIDVCMDMFFSGYRRINVKTYANVFFLLEKYSCRRVQCSNLENAYEAEIREKYTYVDDEKLLELIKQTRLGLRTGLVSADDIRP